MAEDLPGLVPESPSLEPNTPEPSSKKKKIILSVLVLILGITGFTIYHYLSPQSGEQLQGRLEVQKNAIEGLKAPGLQPKEGSSSIFTYVGNGDLQIDYPKGVEIAWIMPSFTKEVDGNKVTVKDTSTFNNIEIAEVCVDFFDNNFGRKVSSVCHTSDKFGAFFSHTYDNGGEKSIRIRIVDKEGREWVDFEDEAFQILQSNVNEEQNNELDLNFDVRGEEQVGIYLSRQMLTGEVNGINRLCVGFGDEDEDQCFPLEEVRNTPEPIFTHLYTQSGEYQIALKAYLNDQIIDQQTQFKTIEIEEREVEAPQVESNGNLEPTIEIICQGEQVGQTMTVKFTSRNIGTDNENSWEYTWNFGDGETAIAPLNTEHTYGLPNIYNVSISAKKGKLTKDFNCGKVKVTTEPTQDKESTPGEDAKRGDLAKEIIEEYKKEEEKTKNLEADMESAKIEIPEKIEAEDDSIELKEGDVIDPLKNFQTSVLSANALNSNPNKITIRPKTHFVLTYGCNTGGKSIQVIQGNNKVSFNIQNNNQCRENVALQHIPQDNPGKLPDPNQSEPEGDGVVEPLINRLQNPLNPFELPEDDESNPLNGELPDLSGLINPLPQLPEEDQEPAAQAPLRAVCRANTMSPDVDETVYFEGSNTEGDFTVGYWEFGDGNRVEFNSENNDSLNREHRYNRSGNVTAKLVVQKDGQSSECVLTLNVLPEPTPTQCNDGKDNDGDGFIDMADPGCSSYSDDNEVNGIARVVTQCSDGKDNDGDGFIDLHDIGCQSASDDNERNPAETILPGGEAEQQACLKESKDVLAFADIKNSYAEDVILNFSGTYYNGVDKAFRGDAIINGYDENGKRLFKPDQPIRRDEAIKILTLATCLIEQSGNNTQKFVFLDKEFKEPNYWAKEVIYRAANTGLVKKESRMYPDTNITRAEFMKMLTILDNKLRGTEISECQPGEEISVDIRKKDWYCRYVKTMSKLGIAGGSKDLRGNIRYYPNAILTRTDAVVWLNNYLSVINN